MLAERLILLRKEKELTQQGLADILKMSRGTYAQYEIGRREPDYETLKLIATFFRCTTDYLLGLSDQKIPIPVDLAAHQIGEETEKHKRILEDALLYAWNLHAKEDDKI